MLKSPVFYLRRSDFDKHGNLLDPIFENKIVIVFIHADYCGYCQMAKPYFQKAAELNTNKNIYFGAIDAYGENEGEKECSNIFDKILKNFQGFPDYVFFINRKPKFIELEGRDTESILKTVNKLSFK